MVKKYKVAVYVHSNATTADGKYKPKYTLNAYTRDYNPMWQGCNIINVTASSGREAKARAADIIRLRLRISPEKVKIKHGDAAG